MYLTMKKILENGNIKSAERKIDYYIGPPDSREKLKNLCRVLLTDKNKHIIGNSDFTRLDIFEVIFYSSLLEEVVTESKDVLQDVKRISEIYGIAKSVSDSFFDRTYISNLDTEAIKQAEEYYCWSYYFLMQEDSFILEEMSNAFDSRTGKKKESIHVEKMKNLIKDNLKQFGRDSFNRGYEGFNRSISNYKTGENYSYVLENKSIQRRRRM